MNILSKGSPAKNIYPHIHVFVNNREIGDYFTPADYQQTEFSFDQNENGNITIGFAMDNDYLDSVKKEDRNAFVQNIYINSKKTGRLK